MRFLALLLALAAVGSAQVFAKKEFVSERNGLYTIRVSYRKGTGSPVSDVRISDSLPEHLELAQGQLSANGPNPTKEDYQHEYAVRVVDWEFSLANRTAEFTLPGATISFTKDDGSDGSVKSNALPLTVSGPVFPGGVIDQPVVIFALTLVMPVLVAYFGINFFGQRAEASKKKR
eukprot:TRINITY_DN17879_c0_g1_i1.p1 TRINITY_DN17879_c0_g1~~TRINITY_DN17879_c0_g1_i1.p1  ORF type:complete len:175 (-),score=36.68 TRINITY_DN17879_c0_g1_i1:36-560(-)